MKFTEVTTELNNSKLTFQVGKLAKASHVSILGRLGDTCVLITINTAAAKEDMDYLPLSVEYVEKLYAGGRIKGSRWVKREGKPSDEAILNARLIDRSIRPLFPKSYRKAIQVVITLLSVDGVNSPEILAALTVSAALQISAIPWNGPLATTRIGHVINEGVDSFIINPKEEEQKYSDLDLVVASSKKKAVMIETQAEQLPEKTILEGIKKAQEENIRLIGFIEDLQKKVGLKKEEFVEVGMDEKLEKILKKDFSKQIDELNAQKAQKEFEDKDALNGIVSEVVEKYKDEFDKKTVAKAIDTISKEKIKENVLKTKKRIDGRGPDEIREIVVEASVLPRIHGSAIFQRGDTQVLSIVTLGAPSLEQLIEGPEGEEAKRYIHHYFMPPYSLGEVGRIGFPSRREIGHGALAEKAIEPVLPDQKDFPYTIRVVSEILSSNGSTSQASVCGSTLALMDAGVPIKAPIAGIAMGLYGDPEKDYVILTDIMGVEDFTGEMDFKVAGSDKGITAIQLDVKNDGLPEKFIIETLEKAKKARDFILSKMNAVLDKPRTEISQFAPKVVVLTPPQEKIGEIIGPGGKNIKNLIAKTDTDINVSSDGTVTISGLSKEKVDEAAQMIENMIREVEEGEEFEGEVKRILPFGAFVEVLPGKEGMVHVSKMGKGFVKDPSEVVKIGQKVRVKVIQIDNQNRINLQLLS
ncbi:polyribonucleotide nucleotidyltransferase [Candidatus Roizmanbacteria bacterium RIFCSPLOWO2_12_FULL_40_12]|uniref:Polyribonucleotide nucleotidyltransferase n=1 Tax=Candidatus Roizmanbacteria bacterium RIFCSPLOWO2_01_FULL_40_42 TaxID=1802066 RepID=A0A1F7J4R8_9BACT|nr:MAG: polyribonucleotide nucleotidyltransferase [Candidatus Roizmanbacteria bacterium RIFCSPHIGHO2_01_FULL_40_98]OGK27369.1 MAG: polyribonucleotide nucleotidyltransferase [Candidatus Roizmanbacteria bacterium RIFCSPHIGHO2_02_FULL_40_53]OGK30759.1 MAG: polyribonucleotide nucleotidyltransferase [Candidatus Roizmanbacteria bacterium RIFCSPHIGHO2_12_41_18]OGK36474.1 MAG: polyribonucleotide nucleotidyltransferase [Candidatus Roizmanbacteria bacterium RIFCSPHIGHO2_12_FULL_40_130]OGK50602.1 MAG: pol